MSDGPGLLGNGEGYESLDDWIGALQGEVMGLREVLADERDERRSFMVAATEFGELNEKLRAVVEAARNVLRTNTPDTEDQNHWALVALVDALHVLDGICTCPKFDPETTPFTLYDTACPVHGQSGLAPIKEGT